MRSSAQWLNVYQAVESPKEAAGTIDGSYSLDTPSLPGVTSYLRDRYLLAKVALLIDQSHA